MWEELMVLNSQGSHNEKVTSEQRFEEGEGIRHANISEKEQKVQREHKS